MAKSDITFYADEHISHSVIKALRAQNITITHAGELGMLAKDDDTEHLPFAASLGAVLFTRDKPFAGRTSMHTDHVGLICWTGEQTDIGGIVQALIEFAEQYSPDEVRGRVFWLKR